MKQMTISVVCCEDTPDRHSRIVEVEVDFDALTKQVPETIDQELIIPSTVR